MFLPTTSSSNVTRMTRSTRQSGLKKPRPLRSVSLQEQSTDKENKKCTPERQLSNPVGSCAVGNEFSVSQGISAMSALITAEAEGDTRKVVMDTLPQENQRSFYRQDSSSSYNSCLDSESGSSFQSLSRQNSLSTEANTTVLEQHESAGLAVKDTAIDVNSNSISFNGSFPDTNSSCLFRNDKALANVPMVTLRISSGEKITLTGRSMPTILSASKILVREMNASIVSMKIEDFNEGKSLQPQVQGKTESNSPPSYSEVQLPKENKKIRYSKEDLLALSECDIARKPPANWNILIHTHSDCCLPAYKRKEYFEAIDFHAHDGTLVMEDRRIRDRRD